MKTIHLLRHAKSSWADPQASDRERPLNKRGQRDAPRMGVALAKILQPMSITTSSANRAKLTLQGLCAGWPELSQQGHHSDDDLYTFDSSDLIAWLQQRPEDQSSVFIIGHNPAFTDLVNALTGEYSLANLPTAGYVQLTVPVDRWRNLQQAAATAVHSLFVKTLPPQE
jgi:phosphohistidine phosphatase